MQSRRQYDTGAENNSRASDVRGVAEIQVLEAVIKVQKLHPSSVSSFQTRQILAVLFLSLTEIVILEKLRKLSLIL